MREVETTEFERGLVCSWFPITANVYILKVEREFERCETLEISCEFASLRNAVERIVLPFSFSLFTQFSSTASDYESN